MNFNDFDWHDSIIKKIEINREKSRESDSILFEIDFYDIGSKKLIFENVYQAQINMNFGIDGHEFIDIAYTLDEENDELINFYKKFNWLLGDENCSCYVIKTITTGSKIVVFAKSFIIK